MSGRIRTLALVLVLAVLLAHAAHALPRGAGFTASDRGGLAAVLWSWLSRMTAFWGEKEGSSMDPNGQPQGDAGSQMDPNGQPLSGVTTKAGSSMDPNGQPQSALPSSSTGDEGSQMDPNG